MSEAISIRFGALSVDEVTSAVARPGAGAVSLFLGVVRDESAGRVVTSLEYTAYESMAVSELSRIANEIEAAMPHVRLAVHHRLGHLQVGDVAVVCAASAPHRHEAFVGCRTLIDRIKHEVPIWKREFGPTGAAWVGWEDARCSHLEHA